MPSARDAKSAKADALYFLPDICVPCDGCKGQRYNRETLDIRHKGCNLYEVSEITARDALEFYQAVPDIAAGFRHRSDIGLPPSSALVRMLQRSLVVKHNE